MALPYYFIMPPPGYGNFYTYSYIRNVTGLPQTQTSRCPSSSSESSGIGSLGSLKSKSVSYDSLPTSPQTTEKKLYQPFAQPPPPLPPKEEEVDGDVKIFYGGRDILNLGANLTDSRWNYHATELPPMNPELFFGNRSQYHRLGPVGTLTKFVKDSCNLCGFTWTTATTD